MNEHSENEIYALLMRLSERAVNDPDIHAVYLDGYLQALRDVEKIMCEKVEKVPSAYMDRLIVLMHDRTDGRW